MVFGVYNDVAHSGDYMNQIQEGCDSRNTLGYSAWKPETHIDPSGSVIPCQTPKKRNLHRCGCCHVLFAQPQFDSASSVLFSPPLFLVQLSFFPCPAGDAQYIKQLPAPTLHTSLSPFWKVMILENKQGEVYNVSTKISSLCTHRAARLPVPGGMEGVGEELQEEEEPLGESGRNRAGVFTMCPPP